GDRRLNSLRYQTRRPQTGQSAVPDPWVPFGEAKPAPEDAGFSRTTHARRGRCSVTAVASRTAAISRPHLYITRYVLPAVVIR
ncbi:MAG TPA: hypothetical protein VLG74_01395, partial [Blastocatellia bacterium]|nr:hypothetical protein [Blastocatellia bacterium]